MIRLIALDLDDTTLRSDSTLDPVTADALRDAAAAGAEIVIASGRAFASLPKDVLSLGVVRYAVTSNGAAVVDAVSGERIISFCLSKTAVDGILSRFSDELLECCIAGRAYTDRRYVLDPVAYGCSPEYIEYVKTTRTPVDDMPSFIRENETRLDSVDVVCRTPERRERLFSLAETIDDVYLTSSSPRLVEISAAESGKGASLRKLCSKLSIPAECVAAFGNGDNDADMLRFAHLGVAVENATDKCKAAADHICPANDENGVAQTLRKIIGGELC